MKLFLDTADVGSIQQYLATGLIDGVTTNTTSILKQERTRRNIYTELKLMGVKDISMEVPGDAPTIVSEAHNLIEELGEVCTIKVPCTRDGLMACKELSREGIRVNVMLVFSAAQAILAAKSGAHYVTAHVGRCDENSVAGLEVVRSIAETYARQGVQTQVVAASIRDVYKVTRSFYNGADVVTMPPDVFERMYDHVLTREGILTYDRDWWEFSHLAPDPEPIDE